MHAFVNVSFVSNLVYTLDGVLYSLLPTFVSRLNKDRTICVNQYENHPQVEQRFLFLVRSLSLPAAPKHFAHCYTRVNSNAV